ncbi:MAG: ABC transporter substrate-binding protein [Asticcacaulis sp.]|uniref:ABC transporter substrate-binding protein n=1 Tax=Asticcacaulis sp. TaxID=1872648 RepID=UPI003F7CBC3B
MKRRSFLGMMAATPALALLENSCSPAAPRSQAYARSSHHRLAEARREGVVTVYSATEKTKMQPLIDDFQKAFAPIRVDYVNLHTIELNRQIIKEGDEGAGLADIAWSSAMDRQIKLVNDGYARPYESPEARALPEWAVWKRQAYGATAEPIVFAYNKTLMDPADLPSTHGAFVDLLTRKPDTYRRKVATYDPLASAAGYLFLSQDEQATPDTDRLLHALADVDTQLYAASQEMVSDLAAGKRLLAYNLISSYVSEQAHAHSPIGLVVPQDYTLLMSRIVFIPRVAPHPNAASVFLDYLLSKRGQSQLSNLFMNPVRTDMTQGSLLETAHGETRGIRLGPALLVGLDKLKRRRFAERWREIFPYDAAAQPPSVTGDQV